MTFYRSIIRQAILISWHNKYLWFFGLFATLLSSNFEIELVNRFTNGGATPYDFQRWWETGIFNGQTWINFFQLATTDTATFISIILLVAVLITLAVAIIWLAIVSQVALVNSASKIISNAKKSINAKNHDTSLGLQEGRKHFWPVLGLQVLVRVLVYGLAATTVIPVLLWVSKPTLTFSLAYLVIFLIFFAIALAISLVAKYAIAAITIKGQRFSQAISSSWDLFWKNWLVSLEMAFILFAISIIATFAIILAILIVGIPVVFLLLLTLYLNSFILWVSVIAIGAIISFGILIIGGSIVTVIQTVAWVTLYNQLNGKGVESKLERVFGE
ncbi:hypothetical protein IPN41_00850 [Candidatus Falkowbacteria bacterium]|nr:MAG: hypothetical protein IPN41_00850 [Candidatus Falkowbacteria bacterium]